jgi:hypothetical protein
LKCFIFFYSFNIKNVNLFPHKICFLTLLNVNSEFNWLPPVFIQFCKIRGYYLETVYVFSHLCSYQSCCWLLMQPTATRVHSVIFVIFIKIKIFPFSASILTFSTQNHLILTYFTHFDTTHFSINNNIYKKNVICEQVCWRLLIPVRWISYTIRTVVLPRV